MRYQKILFISLLILALSYFFWRSSTEKIKNLDISQIINYNEIYFAWEKTPIDNENYFNREKLVRELSINRFNVYQFVLYHKRESIYFPIIEKKLKEAWIPDDFKYLAVAESWLKNDALSDANAGWIWQFIPETATRFWLTVNSKIDERYNFEKETDAAVKYFKKMYEDFHDWTLVAASFNRWENGIRRALDDQKVKSYYNLYLNDETSRYVFRILAIKYLMENRYKIFDSSELWDKFEAPKTKDIQVWKIDDLKSWSNEKWYIYANIKQLNWWIIWDSLPEWKWTLKVFDY
jgi:hypothetical protein